MPSPASTPPHRLPVTIRPERGDDADEAAAISALVAAAFGSEFEARLVAAIRASANYIPAASLVAVDDAGRVVGHVMVSHVTLRGPDGDRRIASLAPLAVAPHAQGRGVGSALVGEVLRVAEAMGEPLVVLEGSPAYYSRLGFEHSVPCGIEMPLPDWASPEAGQLVRLAAYDPTITGTVVYPPYFDEAAANG